MDDSSNKRTKNKSENKRTDIIKNYIVPCVLLVILAVIVSWITYYRIKIQINVGPGWDTYAFLANALEFAGRGIGYTELERPPFLSLLTSIIFRLGYIDETVIFFVDGALFVFGVIGLYLFLKLRFDTIQSFLGALLFASFPIVLEWVGTGYTDIASVSFSIWALYLTVLAVKKDSRFFYLSFPLAMLALFTRFTAGFIIFPIILYIIMGGKYLKDFKNMVGGVFAAIIVAIPFLAYFYSVFGDPFFPFSATLTLTEVLPAEKVSYVTDSLYYIKNIPSYIIAQNFSYHWIVYVIILIILIGAILYLISIIKTELMRSRVKKGIYDALNIQRKHTRIKLVIALFLLVIFILTFGRISYIVSDLLFLSLSYLAYNLLKSSKAKIDIDLLFLMWFVAYFTFHSSYGVKVDRYFVTMAPAFSYFIVLGLSEITDLLKVKVKNINLTSWILSIILIFMVLSSAIAFIHDMPQKKDYLVGDSMVTSNWFEKYEPNYKTKIVYSDLWPVFSWYLKDDVKTMPLFNDTRAFGHELEKYNADYYFTLRKNLTLTSYDKVATFGSVIVYKKNSTKIGNKPRMLYIGKNWNRYMDDVVGFKAFLIHELLGDGRFPVGKSMYIDNYSLNELKKYPYVLLYNFKWHDQKKAENLIRGYVESGETVVIDASGNLEGVSYNLDNSVFLNTLIIKKTLPTNPKIWISPKLNKQNINFSPFISDSQTWSGATYEPYGENKIENLVTANGDTLIGVQKVGKGEIIWIGFNFVWHAFHLGNSQEKKLIQKALGLEQSMSTPTIKFTYIPLYGSFKNLTGKVANINPTNYRIAAYIYVNNGWRTQPYTNHPLTSIRSDGTWTCDITTRANDQLATKIRAYLVPVGYNPPRANGNKALPSELQKKTVSWVEISRKT